MQSLGPRTILYPTPLLVIGSYDAMGRANIMTAAWGGICNSKPPCVTVSLRQATYSYGNIMARRAYTVHTACRDLPAKVDPCVFLPEVRTYHCLGPAVGKAFDLGRRKDR